MQLTEEQLKTIEEYASVFMTPAEIAVVIGIPTDDMISILSDKTHPASVAYAKAKAVRKYEIRKKVLQMAGFGSQSAGASVEQYIVEQTKSERDAGL